MIQSNLKIWSIISELYGCIASYFSHLFKQVIIEIMPYANYLAF